MTETNTNIFSNPEAGEEQDGFSAQAQAYSAFGDAGSMSDTLGGFGSNIPGFPAMGAPGEPTAEEMEKQMEAVRFSKIVKVQDVHVETWDFSVPGQVKHYREKYKELYALAAEGKVYIKVNERQFINCPNNPRWVLHMEWLEYDMQVTDHMSQGE